MAIATAAGPGYNGSIKNTQEKGGYDHETKKIPCPRPCGGDDRSDPHRLRTAGGPLRLVLWGRVEQRFRGNGTGLVESKTLEENIIQWFGLSSATRKKDVAEPMLQEVAKSFDPESWYNNSGELNNTAKEALNKIAKDKLTMTHSHKRTAVDVWEMQPSQTDFDFSENRWLYYDWLTLGGVNSNTPTHTPSWETYGRLKSWIQSTDSFDLYASVFQKNGKTYAAMVMIRW